MALQIQINTLMYILSFKNNGKTIYLTVYIF